MPSEDGQSKTKKSIAKAEPVKKKRAYNHVPKGSYASLADPTYVTKRDKINNSIPQMLNLILRVKRIEHKEMASWMGLSVSALRGRLSGATQISVGELVGMAHLLEVDPQVFLSENATISDIIGNSTSSIRERAIIPSAESGQTAVTLDYPTPTDRLTPLASIIPSWNVSSTAVA